MGIDILTIGDTVIDLYMNLDGHGISSSGGENTKTCFYHGSKILVSNIEYSSAGNALNVAIATRRLGLTSAIYSEIGNDDGAKKIKKALKKEKVITKYLHKNKKGITNINPIMVFNGERTIFSHHEKRNYYVGKWPTPKWIYYTSMSEGFQHFQKELIKYLEKHPDIVVAFNPGTVQMKNGVESFKDFLKYVDVLLVNKVEASKITGMDDDLHKNLQMLGPKLTVITDGKAGASAYDGNNVVKIEPFEIDEPVRDKTGAGDAFSASFISALFYKKPLREALMWGAINSSFVIRKIGATHGLLTKPQLKSILQPT